MRLRSTILAGLVGTIGLMTATSANASLTVFKQFNGNFGLSTDGGGSTANSYGISAFVPVGATVAGAYLYQSNSSGGLETITFNGTTLSFSALSVNTSQPILTSARADVTSLVAPIINGGIGGTYNFTIGEGNSGGTDGTALVVVYSLASLPTQTVAILDGFSAVGGDRTALNFAEGIDPTAAGFVADLRLGIGYSFPPQSSNVSINGTQITAVAGGFDDGQGANGGLITVGGNDDPFSTLNPAYNDDHERYNITPYLKKGDTSIVVNTNNPSGDDNIFLATFLVSGAAGVNAPPPPTTPAVPEPATWLTMILGFGTVGVFMRRSLRRSNAKFDAKIKRITSGAAA